MIRGLCSVGRQLDATSAAYRQTPLILELGLSIIYHHRYVRVIGGTFGGRRLGSVDGPRVRPTSDRLRETLFNILAPRIADSRFLDICAGSGAVGIEALSRGASHTTFIDKSRHACSVIEDNLAALGIDEMVILNRDAMAALRRLGDNELQFDVIFLDPPYASEIYEKVMETLGSTSLVADGGIVVVEHRAKLPPQKEYGELRMYRHLKQGESALAFYGRV